MKDGMCIFCLGYVSSKIPIFRKTHRISTTIFSESRRARWRSHAHGMVEFI
jgi:hypothetical protein